MPLIFEGNVSVFQKQQLDEAMLYLTRAEGMADIAYALASQNVNIKFVYDGRDAYIPSTNTIVWDPNSALSVLQPDGTVGVQSPALGLFHEMVHWLYAHNGTRDEAESAATTFETRAAISIGEAVRTYYNSVPKWTPLVSVNNPTAHTAGGHWVAIDVNGNPVTGPKYDPNEKIVSIAGGPNGSTGTPSSGGSGGGGSGSGEHGGVGGVGSGTQVGGTDLGNPAGGGHTGGVYAVPLHLEAPGPYDEAVMPAEQAVMLVGEIQLQNF